MALGGMVLSGCSKAEKAPWFGNQDKLWQLTSVQAKAEEPIELTYAKETPALYRDASMGKADPSFTPKVTGG
jgi:hypothetical protein